jgi:hypothetical protein
MHTPLITYMLTLTLSDDSKTAFINKASLPHIFNFVLPFVGPRPLFQFLEPTHRQLNSLYGESVARPLSIHRTAQTQRKEISVLRV